MIEDVLMIEDALYLQHTPDLIDLQGPVTDFELIRHAVSFPDQAFEASGSGRALRPVTKAGDWLNQVLSMSLLAQSALF
jgi:hypothetical protein